MLDTIESTKHKNQYVFFLKHASDHFSVVVEKIVARSWLSSQTVVHCDHKVMLLLKGSEKPWHV